MYLFNWLAINYILGQAHAVYIQCYKLGDTVKCDEALVFANFPVPYETSVLDG